MLLATLLTGCAGPQGLTTEGSMGATEGTATAPSSGKFSSAWAEMFDYSYSIAQTEVERRALEDERIDDQEYEFFRSRILECLSTLGVDAKFEKDKSLSYTLPGDITGDQITECMQENGLHILTLRDSMDRNPQNLDENTIMADCLKRAGVVDEGYTADDYANGEGADKITPTTGFDECNADPLGYKSGS